MKNIRIQKMYRDKGQTRENELLIAAAETELLYPIHVDVQDTEFLINLQLNSGTCTQPV